MTRFAIIIALTQLVGCKRDSRIPDSPSAETVPIEVIDRPPKVTEADREFAGVYGPLDGVWKGKFEVWVDTSGQQEAPVQPTSFDLDAIVSRPEVERQTVVDVTQTYTSESPFFQRVEIVDRYDDGRTAKSRGVNKIQGGKLYCVVQKPDDLVVHDGTFEAPKTIIWSRDRAEPRATEYFREVVEADTYTIEGWGYYGSDDVDRAPRMWFRSTYRRQ